MTNQFPFDLDGMFCSFFQGLDLYKKLYVGRESEVAVKTEEAEPSPDIKPDPEKDNVLHQQWQINLLDHIEAMQNQVTHRMDLIEKELDGETYATQILHL